MRLTAIISFLLLLPWSSVTAQQPVPRDTSFTIRATYIKEKKYRSYIEVALPKSDPAVKSKADIPYRYTGNRNLLLDIYYPKKKKPRHPAVLLIFGGGWRSGDKSQNQAMAMELASKGYVAVSAEYRLTPEAVYPAAVHDLKAAIRWMRRYAKQYGIDTSRIAVLGCSAGGQLAALVGTTNNDPAFDEPQPQYPGVSSNVQAIIDIDGVLAFHHPESTEGTVAAQWLSGTYPENPANWEAASALNHVNANTPPVLFVNSSLPRFHAGRDDMIAKMNQLGIYSEVHTLPDTPHPFWFFHPWFNTLMEYCVAFLNKTFTYSHE